MTALNILVLDVGRTHVKACLVDGQGVINKRFETDNSTRMTSGIPVFEVDQIWRWFKERLTEVCKETRLDAISVTTHGAAAAFLNETGDCLGVLDYESSLYEEISDEYNKLRDSYEQTLSPALANGLNLGRQIFWLQKRKPALFGKVSSILTYPQYWSYRLSGVKAIEATSLGTHTDLWRPNKASFSTLVDDCGWTPLLPELVKAWETVGKPLPEICEETGLNSDCRILSGIHDSNATFAYHYEADKPMTLLSTGTWVIGMNMGNPSVKLRENMDELANVNLLGDPLPSFRFMGGREWQQLTKGCEGTPDSDVLGQVIDLGIYALPSFSDQGGPYRDRPGKILGPSPTDLQRKALASLYCAQITASCLNRFGCSGRLIIDGPFIRDEDYLRALVSLLPDCELLTTRVSDGTALGASRLAIWPSSFSPEYQTIDYSPLEGLSNYHATWLEKIER